jgi:hypothetical protein
MSMRDDARIRAALTHAVGCPCLLCDGEADYVCAWVPSAAYGEVFEQPPDEREQTAFAYALCADCQGADDARARATATLVQKWRKRCDD